MTNLNELIIIKAIIKESNFGFLTILYALNYINTLI
jgi:hypothetical protein